MKEHRVEPLGTAIFKDLLKEEKPAKDTKQV